MDPDQLHFSEWAFLARTDPEVFERRRRECIDAWIAGTGKYRPQLEALQSRIDAERKRAGSPQEAVAAITSMMCASLSELAGELKVLSADLRVLERHTSLRPEAPGAQPMPAREEIPAA